MDYNSSYVAEENPYTIGNKFVEDNQKALRRVDDGAKLISNDGDLEGLSEKSLNLSVQDQDNIEVENMEVERQNVNRGIVETLAGMKREDLIPKALAQTKEDYEQSFERAKSAVNPFFARVYNTPGAENLTDQEILDIAINDYTLDSFAAALDAQGGWETAGDILNMMVIPDVSYNAAKLSDGNWFTSLEGMQELAMKRNNLSPDERIKFDATLKGMIQDVESSQVQQYITMLDVMGLNTDMALDHYSDKLVLLDVATLGTGIVKGLRKLNKMRQLGSIGDYYGAAKASDIVSKNKDASKGLGIPELDAAMEGNPLKEAAKDILSGTSDAPSYEIRTRLDRVDDALARVDSVTGVTPLPTDKEKAEMAARWRKHMEANDTIESVDIRETAYGVSIDYKTPEGADNIYVEYTLDDLGGFNQKEVDLFRTATRYVWSPSFMQKGDKDLLVSAPTIGILKRAKIAADYNRAVKEALKPVKGNKKSLQKINHVLGKMNGLDMPNDRHTMVNVGIGGTKLTDKEYDAFVGIRRIFDHMHNLNNETIRSEMAIKGLSNVSILDNSYYVKKFDLPEDATKAYNLDVENNQVMLSDGSVFDRVSDEVIAEQYALGNKLVRVDGNDQYGWFKNGDDNHSRYAFVKSEDIGGIPDQVLPYTPNYIPRTREESNYFIKKKVAIKVNGNKKFREKTVAWAHTEQQANAYLSKLAKADPTFDKEDWVVSFDREVASSSSSDNNTIRMNGGLYRGSRSSTAIEFAGDVTEGKVVDALDTLQNAISYTADRASMSRMRLVMRHRWYQDAAAVDQDIMKLSWNEARGAVAESSASPQVKAKLLSSHDQISNVSSIPTKSEQALRGALKAIAKNADKYGKDNIARYFYRKAKGSNPIDLLKGTSFHMTLGVFNPAQYLVQMMGAAAAMGANPVSFTKASPRILAASLTDMIDDKLGFEKTLRYLNKKGVIPDSVKDDVEFWRTSGMYESVLRGNADFDNSGKFMPIDAGVMRRAFSSLADKSTMFYEAGELANMRISFFTALEHEKAIAGKAWKYNTNQLQQVVARAEQYRLGMSAANKAQYQKGLMSLPTQFKSIYTKLIETLAGDDFTKAEKARIVGSQVALFGAAGIPFFNYWADNITDMLAPEGATAEELRAIREGAVGWLISEYWDIDAVVAGRVAIAGDIVGEIQNLMSSEESFVKTFMGASFTTTSRSIDAIKNMFMAGKMLWEDEDIESIDKVGMAATVAAQELLNIPTSTRRMMEAYVLHSFGEVRTSGGRTLYSIEKDDVQMRDVVARALGFSSNEMQEIYETNQALYKRKDKIRDVADFYVNTLNRLAIAVDEGDEDTAVGVHMVLSAIKKRFENDLDRQDVIDAITAAMKDRKFKDRTIMDWLKHHESELLNAKGRLFITGESEYEERTK